MLHYLSGMAMALFLTIIIEEMVAWLMGLRSKKALFLVLLVNVITNPAANWFHLALLTLGIPAGIGSVWEIGLEIAVIAIETRIYRGFQDREWFTTGAFPLTLIGNLTSYGIGVAIHLLR